MKDVRLGYGRVNQDPDSKLALPFNESFLSNHAFAKRERKFVTMSPVGVVCQRAITFARPANTTVRDASRDGGRKVGASAGQRAGSTPSGLLVRRVDPPPPPPASHASFLVFGLSPAGGCVALRLDVVGICNGVFIGIALFIRHSLTRNCQ